MSRRDRSKETIGGADAAKVYEEFVATFEGGASGSVNKVWVKAGVYDAGARREDTSEKGKLYKPTSKIAELAVADSFASKQAMAQSIAASLVKEEKPKKKEKEKKKSNLELFKEELKLIQTEREERHKIKTGIFIEPTRKTRFEPIIPVITHTPLYDEIMKGGDNPDPNTTNIYLANLSPKVSEQQLMEVFGKFGPLASIKIMWPRTDEEKSRGKNCGFVAYMTRKDGERCMRKLLGKDVYGFEMKMSWGKCVPIPPRPIYIPPRMLQATLPPPPSGLPFNAQPINSDKELIPPPGIPFPNCEEEEPLFEEVLQRAMVKVCVPTERSLLVLIHRMVEFVVREGPMFEAMMMNKEIDNPMFRFLFDNRSPAHIYYRWKLFSILQGDSPTRWNMDMFRMFEGGSIWLPPQMNPFTQGMPDDLASDGEDEDRRRSLSKAQRRRLESTLRHLRPERREVGDAMLFCMEHADAADEVAQCITESLMGESTAIFKKVARLYLLSDILYNTTARVSNSSLYRKAFQDRIADIFQSLNETYEGMEGQKAEAFKQRILQTLKAWQDWLVYPQELLIKIQNIFMGYSGKVKEEEIVSTPKVEPSDDDGQPLEDIDGAPMTDDDDDDGMPLDGAALLRQAGMLQKMTKPATPKESPRPASPPEPKKRPSLPGFKPSKWEAVDPTEVESQAVTSSKWEAVEPGPSAADEDVDGMPLDDENSQTSEASVGNTEDRRMLLREIEMKVVKYQDALENGIEPRRKGLTIADQIDAYRQMLIRTAARENNSDDERQASPVSKRGRSRSRSRSESPRERRRSKPSSKRGRRSRSRSRSRSPDSRRSSRYSRSRSRSPSRKSRKGRY